MTTRPPADAAVALRSLQRRFRELLGDLGTGELVEESARTPGSDGRSALDHVCRAGQGIEFLTRSLPRVLTEDDPVLDPAPTDAPSPDRDQGGTREAVAGATWEERLAEFGRDAARLADRIDGVPAGDWVRSARVRGDDRALNAADLLWETVDYTVGQLKEAQRVVSEVRRGA